MDIENIIKNRRSVRKYRTSQSVKKEDIIEILELAMHSPSACNRQAHKVIYIQKKEMLEKLVEQGAALFLKKASAVLLFLYDDIGDNIEYKDDIQSSSALIQNFLLLAHSKGLGACWVCHLPPKRRLRSIFNIPKGITPVAAVSIGYPEKIPAVVPRKHKITDIFFEENLPQGIKVNERDLKLFVKRILRKIYYILPVFISKWLITLTDKHFVKKFKN
ncbi:NADH dehydrogenase [Candidatus Magnetomorum sp. HK-1]|nr:NADH dehydrogenase [Candidatus Magnetomorum sp. HK-1]